VVLPWFFFRRLLQQDGVHHPLQPVGESSQMSFVRPKTWTWRVYVTLIFLYLRCLRRRTEGSDFMFRYQNLLLFKVEFMCGISKARHRCLSPSLTFFLFFRGSTLCILRFRTNTEYEPIYIRYEGLGGGGVASSKALLCTDQRIVAYAGSLIRDSVLARDLLSALELSQLVKRLETRPLGPDSFNRTSEET
jgi:hypothetical protein